MVSLADVRRWDPAGVEAAFTGLGVARDRLLGVDDELRTAAPPPDWSGTASDAARAEHDRVAERLRRVTAGIAALRPSLAAAADAVVALSRDLDQADHLAAAHGFPIGPAGIVTDVRQTVLPVDQIDAYNQQRGVEQAEVLTLLGGVPRRATDIDTDLADLLARAVDEQIDDGGGISLLGAATTGLGSAVLALPAPPTGTPAQNNAWWDGLTPGDQERVISAHPEWVANRDGIPAAARDEANRARLLIETARLDRELADTTSRWHTALDEPLPAGMEGQGETAGQLQLRQDIERLQARRDVLGAVATTVNTGPDRHLLLLDVSGHDQPRAAIAVGDVDTADHVAVFTPGFTTTVAGSLGSYTDDLSGVQRTSEQQLTLAGRGGETVAGVAWLGYDAPQWSTTLDPDDSVASSAPAQDGGRQLAGFLDGVGAARNDDPHLTALGHSYGSTTTGYALQHTAVDDAVLFGSPGAGTDDITDLHVPDGHTAVLEARHDPVADVAHFGGDPNQLDGVANLSSREETGPDGRPLRESVGHSDYLAPGTTSQHNIAATVAGLPERRISGDNSGIGDWIW